MSDLRETSDFLIATWHRVYGDGDGWATFKTAVDEGRFDHALEVLAPGVLKLTVVKPLDLGPSVGTNKRTPV